MKLRSFLSRLQKLNEGQETALLPADEIVDIIYHSMPTMWKDKMIEQGFNYADSTIKEMSDFSETRVEHLEPKEENKIYCSCQENPQKVKKRKREDNGSIVVESSEESAKAYCPSKKYCILHSKCSHTTDRCKDLHAMVNTRKQKKKKSFRNYGKSNKELNALIEKKFQKFVKNKK